MRSSARRILVVEDHPDSRDVLVFALQKWGYEVVEARDGREAIIKFGLDDFDLVVVDIALPFLSGREVARAAKSNPHTKDIPVLAVTALDSPEQRKMCLEAGFNDFLPKPFSITDFKRAVEILLSSPQKSL